MVRRVILLIGSPFTLRDYERFGVDILAENGFEVEVWDLTHILRSEAAKSYRALDLINWKGCRIFKDKKQLLNELRNLSFDTFIVILFHYLPERFPIYRAISAGRAEYAAVTANAIPQVKDENRTRSPFGMLKKLRKMTWRKFINYAFNKCPFRLLGIKPVRLILAGGAGSIRYSTPSDNSTEILWAHTLDYDLYLKEKNRDFNEHPIAVFLDEYVPFHPDYIFLGQRAPIAADEYYSLLNKFFKRLESELKLEVVIAAHPKSRYEKGPDYFEGRKVLKNRTIELVRESKLILAHSSTTVNFANLFFKPIVFLTSSELDRSYQGPLIRTMAKLYDKKPVFLDSDIYIDWESELRIQRDHYDAYKRNYIKKEGSPDLPFWQIVADRLKKKETKNALWKLKNI